MKKHQIVRKVLGDYSYKPGLKIAKAFAPSNIALVKYWGKRDLELNLPVTSSLSISLGDKGTNTSIAISDFDEDEIFLNGENVAGDSAFAKRLSEFLDLFRTENDYHFKVETFNNIPTAAGLASSASGFAAVTLALNELFEWRLEKKELSILARMGSGSAARSLWQGFVKWHKGERKDGMDCFAEKLSYEWPELRVGLLAVATTPKEISSREAMNRTVATSRLYKNWSRQVEADLQNIELAIAQKDFDAFGKIAEKNAIAMHATMHDAIPPINYDINATIELKNKIWKLRQEGLQIYFTQDAGPNLKILFLEKNKEMVKKELTINKQM